MAEHVPPIAGGSEEGPLRLPVEEELIERVAWLVRLRWLAAAGVILIPLVAHFAFDIGVAVPELVLIGAAILAYNLVFFLRLGVLRRDRKSGVAVFGRFASIQFTLDFVALTLLVHFTGGIESPAIFFFIFHAIIASILLSPRYAYLQALVGLAMVVGLVLLEYAGIIPEVPIAEFHDPHLRRPVFLVGMLFFFLGTVLVSIYLASSITRQLARRTKELALLRQKQENAYHQMRILYEVAKAVNSTLDLNDVLDTIVRRATMAMEAKAGSIRLLDDERRFLEISAAFGLSEEYLKKGKVDPQKGGMDRLSLQGKPVMVLDAASDPLFQYPEQARKEGIHSVVSVPLMLQEAAIGVLRVYSGEERSFTGEETEFLMALASQGAVAIQNARAYRHLQDLDEAKSKFVFTVTHDLKAPVAAVQTQFEVLQGGFAGELSPHQRQLIDRAAMRLSGLQTLIGDLLALGALKGKLPAHRTEELDFCEAVRKLCDTVRPEAEVKGVQLWISLPDAPLWLQAAAEEVERLVGNLLENAIKYTRPGGTVSLRLLQEAGHLVLVVADTGIGIPPEALPRLFEEFYRAPNARELGAEGTGLGLSLVKNLVDLYQGDIKVESVLNQGTTFTITLPLNTPQTEPPAAAGV